MGSLQNADALSDLILALAVPAYLGWSAGRQRAAWTGGMLILGIASTLGVLRFSEVPWALGPHKFMSVFSACRRSRCCHRCAGRSRHIHPHGCRRALYRAGGWLWRVGGAHRRSWWGWQALPGLSIILIVATMLQRKSLVGILGSLVGGWFCGVCCGQARCAAGRHVQQGAGAALPAGHWFAAAVAREAGQDL
ncbi:MAG: hypothetical protein IPJ18_09540 [Betaproteobacteria bacterium]|nr:hypothetical protein [Betaproteobacteria bacterium]